MDGDGRCPPCCPFSSVRMVMPRVCPAGRVGGQANQPRPTRNPSPWVKQGGVGASHAVLLGGDASHIDTGIWARPSDCSETLKASWGGDTPRTPCGSMGVIIRWLKGIKQPSRLTCWACSTDIPPVLSMPCSRCTQGMSWRRPANPLSCVAGIRLSRQVQRLDVGRWTGASALGIVPAPARAGPTLADPPP